MNDLHNRFRELDRLDAPDLRERLGSSGPSIPFDDISERPPRRTKVAIIVVALALSVAATGLVIRSFHSGTVLAPATPAPSTLQANGDIWAYVGGGDGPSTIYRVDPGTGSKSILWADNTDSGATAEQINRQAIGSDYSFSPDGSQVAFSSYGYDAGGATYGTELFVMNADGTNIQQLTHDHAVDGFPAWSADGKFIVFASYRGSGYIPGCLGLSICLPHLYLIDASGGTPTQLTDGPLGETAPSWSPDGSKLVFVGVGADGSGKLEIMNADGSGRAQISSGSNALILSPAWSPDGQRILFLKAERGQRFHLWTIAPDGSAGRDLLDTNTDTDSGRPVWSPDGTAIAYAELIDGETQLWVTDTGGEQPHRLTSWPHYGGAPIAWQPVPLSAQPSTSPQASASGP
jgi:TolB protein